MTNIFHRKILKIYWTTISH